MMRLFSRLGARLSYFVVLFAMVTPVAQAGFSDVPNSHPNRTAIESLEQQGIVQGYDDGTFRPEAPVNRVEALKIILLGNHIALQSTGGRLFTDTPAEAWYAPYLVTATNLGIVQGYPDGRFRPEQTVSLVENLKIALLSAAVDTSELSIEHAMYADIVGQQSAWYAPYLQYAKNHHLVDAESGNRINAAQGMTRGHLAELIYRLQKAEDAPQPGNPSQVVIPEKPHAPSGDGLLITVDPTRERTEISPYIYGSNVQEAGGNLFRLGGNRWTAYNWTNNASNAGTDWGPHQSDGYLSESATPGEAVAEPLRAMFVRGADALVTMPIVDFVAADKAGVVHEVASDASTRWVRNVEATTAAFPRAVVQQEFVQWLRETFASQLAAGRRIFISLDNEPALWSSTHALVHPQPVTYAEMAEKTERFAGMIKRMMPGALVFGAVAYGFMEFETLQNAPDSQGRNYLAYFLKSMKEAEGRAGTRLLDVLDLHWYPEARGNWNRITNNNGGTQSQAEVDARLQAPRSLWDASYVEDSWIAKDYLGNKPVRLLPYLGELIEANYPGTKLSFSEYNYGGADHISGGLAQADVLGVFGKYGVFAAAYWPLSTISQQSYVPGAFDLFLNYDGRGAKVGSTSIYTANPDAARLSTYGFQAANGSTQLLMINKTAAPQKVEVVFENMRAVSGVEAYVLTEETRRPKAVGGVPMQGNVLSYTLPAMSAVLVVESL